MLHMVNEIEEKELRLPRYQLNKSHKILGYTDEWIDN